VSSVCPRSGGSVFDSTVRWQARPRRSPSTKKRTAGTRPSRVEVPIKPLPATGRETGIDVGLKVFLITAYGEPIENPRHYRHTERRLARAQRRVSRRTRGSTRRRRRKAVALLTRRHQQVQRQRRDVHHKTALALLRHYDTIYREHARVAHKVRNH